MIKANELRIGNKAKFINKIITVHGGTIEDCYRCYQSGSPFQYEPIELTEIILSKSRFNKIRSYYVHENDIGEAQIRLYIDGNCKTHISVGDDEFGVTLTIIQYVHQLQNLYWSLRNEEIEINL